MIVLEPIATAQPVYLRCRDHNESKQMFVFENGLSGVQAYVTSLTYSDGVLTGNFSIPLTDFDEQPRTFRVFSVDDLNDTIIEIEDDGGATYTEQEWIDLITTLTASGGIEKEIYRGLALVTDQTNLDKYALYG